MKKNKVENRLTKPPASRLYTEAADFVGHAAETIAGTANFAELGDRLSAFILSLRTAVIERTGGFFFQDGLHFKGRFLLAQYRALKQELCIRMKGFLVQSTRITFLDEHSAIHYADSVAKI